MTLPRPQLFGFFAGLCLALGLVGASVVGANAWLKIRNAKLIRVKGSARKQITSDLAIWRGAFTVEAASLLEAQRKLREDFDRVTQSLRNRGFTNVNFSPISIEEITATISTTNHTYTRREIAAYRLTQNVRVESERVTVVAQLDEASTGLVEQGVMFTTQPPEYIYTRAGEAKIEMLAEATKDARQRAEQIAAQGGSVLAGLCDAEMGVIQITPPFSGQTSWEGINDTTSLNKTITAVVTASFALK